MPNRLPKPVYPHEAAVRKVRSNDEIKWRGDLIAISSALVAEAVAVEDTDEGKWRVRFYDIPLGTIDPEKRKDRTMNKCHPCIRSVLSPMYPLDTAAIDLAPAEPVPAS